MNSLYVGDAQAVALRLEDHCLVLEDKRRNAVIGKFSPREFPYDSLVLQRASGYISLAALNDAHGRATMIASTQPFQKY